MTSTAPRHQPRVLVVGAGPVGLVAACELARRDVAVRIIDKLPEPTDESRAILVHARSLEALARVGVVDEVMAAAQRTTGMESTPTARRSDGPRSRPSAARTRSRPRSRRPTPSAVLTLRLAELGVTIERGRELVSLEQDEAAARTMLLDGETVEADWIAGTDGAHSTVRHELGMRLEGSFQGERFLLGDVEADYELDRSSMHTFFVHDRGPLLVFPMLGDRVRLIAEAEAGDAATLEGLQAVIDHHGAGIRLRSARWLTTFEIHHAQAPRYRVGRVFLAGDAAHVHSPAGGQGMNTGIQDAFNLGWKLAAPDPSEALLDAYEAERYPVAEHVIKVTTAMTQAGTVHSSLARRLRNRVMGLATGLAPLAHLMADETEETTIAYHDSPIVAGRRFGHGPRPGDIAPPLVSAPAGHAVLEAGEEYGFAGGGIAVVRPDGYIGLLAEAGDTAAVDAYFAALSAR